MKPLHIDEMAQVQLAINKATSNGGVLTPSETELLARAAWFYLKERLYWEELFKIDVSLTEKGV